MKYTKMQYCDDKICEYRKKQFVQNQPTKFSYHHDGLKTVRNLQTMPYGFVTLIYVDKHPKQYFILPFGEENI